MKPAIKTMACFAIWLFAIWFALPIPPTAAQMAAVTALSGSEGGSEDGSEPATELPEDGVIAETFSYYGFLEEGVTRTQARIAETMSGLDAFPAELDATRALLSTDFGQTGLMRILLFTVIFVGVGILAEVIYRRLSAPACAYLESQSPRKFSERLKHMVGLCVLSLFSLLVFAIGSLGAFMMFDWPPIMKSAVMSLLMAFFALRVLIIVLQFLFAPKAEGLRMINVDPQAATVLTKRLTWAAGISLFAFALANVFGAAPTMVAGDIILFDAAVVISVVAFCAVTLSIGRFFASHAASAEVEKMALPTSIARLWPMIVCGWFILVGGVAIIGAERILKALLAIGLACLFDVVFRNIIESQHRKKLQVAEQEAAEHNARAEAAAHEHDEVFEPVKPKAPVFTKVLKRGVRLLALVFVLASIWRIWGFDRLAQADDAGIIARIIDSSTEIIMILLIADLIWSLIKTFLDERMSASATGNAGDEGGGTGLSRVETLLPLLKNFALTVIVIMVAMVTLSSLGVDIGPLIAGAGVVGLALGFGSQALVRDVVAGVFFLLDDAFRLGEYIEVDNLRGRVENISIRSMQLRHHRGPLQTVPFGEIKSIVNHSRDWVIVKLEFRVPFETDVNKIKKLVKKLAAELLEDPLIGDSFIEPLKSQGVRRMEEFNMVIGLKYTSKPGEQFTIRKTVYQRVLAMFKENGIQMASRNVKVDVPPDATPEQKQEAVAAAAQQASEQLNKPPA
ncbi:mechanosensitive ion channel family protein [Thalassospira tepidiphila]|uniref:Mechanosensitive ion channel protein MscS n=2 Tax=Thalassospira tepidiphila TaxID=393657 RepID=A0A853KV88_9PROT|nr:mechanosensitive ion channel family protein [Thalassospira tepidiphila]NJB76105.1 small-conductance mechanosensitive channel [Thalassospira tepidiphila]OAZ08193.1 mechanosensitive ion channel protein MscS [Thalassospira tepidiphila MCCC 1A03514]